MAPSRQLFLGRKEVEFSSQKRMGRGRGHLSGRRASQRCSVARTLCRTRRMHLDSISFALSPVFRVSVKDLLPMSFRVSFTDTLLVHTTFPFLFLVILANDSALAAFYHDRTSPRESRMIFIISIETNWLKVGYMSVVRLSDIGRKVCYVNHRTIPSSAL